LKNCKIYKDRIKWSTSTRQLAAW